MVKGFKDFVMRGNIVDLAVAFVLGAAFAKMVSDFVSAIIKPILTVLTLPLIIITLGLFLLVINIAMVGLAEWIAPDFSINGFWTYVGVVVILWLVNWIADALSEMFEGEGRRVLA